MSQHPASARGNRRGSMVGSQPPLSPTSSRFNETAGGPPSARRPNRAADTAPMSARRGSVIGAAPLSTPRGQRANGMEETPQRSARGGVPASARRGSVMGALDALQTTGNAMRVYIRVRPFSQREISSGEQVHSTVRIDPENPAIITILEPTKEFRPTVTFSFTRCFWSVFDADNTHAVEAVENVLNAAPPTSSRRSRAASVISPVPSSARRGSAPPALENAPRAPTGGSNPCAVESQVSHPPYAGQGEVYEHVGKPVLENTLDGYNGCVFAYGQTGSGKTFTMMGYAPKKKKEGHTPTQEEAGEGDEEDDEVIQHTADPDDLQGIIPRICKDIFEGLQRKRNDDESLSYRIEVSYFEIYNEKVFDLIRPQVDELKIRNDPINGPYVEGLTTKVVNKEEDIAKVIRKGTLERHTAATKYNDRSSRSHAILTINMTQFFLEQEDTMKMQSKLNLVDLAGSERTGKGGAEGIEKKTGININLSLTVLGRVIDCLADLSQNKSLAVPVPYRESNLTWLLSDSIGGNSQTSMVATISPHTINFEEMRQTLRYASRAKQIIQKARRNEDPQVALIKRLQAEVESLQVRLKEAGGSEYTKEYVQGLERKVKQLEKKVAEQERVIGGLRALLEGAGIADPTAAEGYSDEGVSSKAAMAAKRAKEEMEKKLEKSQMQIAELKAELERRSEVKPGELEKMKEQISKQAKLIASQHHEINNYKMYMECSYINEVMMTVMEKESYFFEQFSLQMLSSNTSTVESLKQLNAKRGDEMEELKARHQELLTEQAQQFQARLKRIMDEVDKEKEETKQKHAEELAQLHEKMKRIEEISEMEKKRLEKDNDDLNNTLMEGLRRQREAHEEELNRLRSRLEADVGDRRKQDEEMRQQQEASRREADRLREELERLTRSTDNEITRLKNQLETEKMRRESDLMEKDRQRRGLEQEAADLHRDLLKANSEMSRMEKEYQDQIRDLMLQQDQLIAVSNSLLADWEGKSTMQEADMCKLRGLIYNEDYINFRQKMRERAFGEKRDYNKELEEIDAKAKKEAMRLSEIVSRAKDYKTQTESSMKKFKEATTKTRTRLNSNATSRTNTPPPPSSEPEPTSRATTASQPRSSAPRN